MAGPGTLSTGKYDAVDSAIRAVVRNKQVAFNGDRSVMHGNMQDYARSVEALRLALQSGEDTLSDQILMSVALLSVVEALMQSDMVTCFAHWNAIGTTELSRPATWEPSELTRAILYHVRNQTFHAPTIMGITSPFDTPRWYNLQPAGHATLPKEVARLKFLGNQLLIQLPRLIMIVWRFRTRTDVEGDKEEAANIIEKLEELHDEKAESDLLHRIKIVRTTHPEDVAFVPFSFDYNNLGELKTALVYWKSHLIFANLKLKMHSLFPDDDMGIEKTRTEMERMGVNIIMSLQFARGRQQYAHARGMVAMPTALIGVWALWNDRDEFRGFPRDRWREWTQHRYNESIIVWSFQASQDDMDQASDLIAGGPLEGMAITAYENHYLRLVYGKNVLTS